MLESVNAAVSDGPGENEEPDRIDAMLTSALADQARERRMLVDTVFGAKTALVKAEEEMSALREAMDKRDTELLEAVRKSNEALAEALTAKIEEAVRAEALTAKIEEAVRATTQQAAKAGKAQPNNAGLTLRIEAIEDGILQLAQRIAEIPGLIHKEMEQVRRDLELVRRDLEVSAVAISDRIGEESGSLLHDLREDQVEVVSTLAALSEKTTGDLRGAIARSQQELMERIVAAGRDATEASIAAGRDATEASASSVEQMVEHLTGYLQARDEQLYRARDQRLVELFQQLSDTIGRTTKRKVGKILESDGAGPPRPVSPPMPPVKAPPPLSVNRSFRSPADQPTQAIRSPFPPPGGPAREEPPPGRPDPAFLFDQPESRPFDAPPAGSADDADLFDMPPGRAFERPRRPSEPERGSGPELNQALANPLSRAELARDYLIDAPDAFGEPPPGHAPAGRARPPLPDEDVRGRGRSPRSPGRTPKPPVSGRGRRKS